MNIVAYIYRYIHKDRNWRCDIIMNFVETFGHGQLVDSLLAGQAAIEVGYIISALVLSGNSFAGFNGIFLGLIYGSSTAVSYYGLRKKISRTMFGVILGCCTVLLFISLESAIFWGQYGNCSTSSLHHNRRALLYNSDPMTYLVEAVEESVLADHRSLLYAPECNRQSAMKAVCAFSVFMFLSYIALIALMLRFKDDILGNAPLDEVNITGAYSSVPTFNPHTDTDLDREEPYTSKLETT